MLNCFFSVGSLWMEHTGTMEITSHSTGLKAVLSFKPGGWFSGDSDLHCVEGFIIDQDKQKLRFLYGRWTEFLCSADPSSLVALLGCKLEKINPDASNLPKHPPLLLGAVPGSSILWEVSWLRCEEKIRLMLRNPRLPPDLQILRSTIISAASQWNWMRQGRGANLLLQTVGTDPISGGASKEFVFSFNWYQCRALEEGDLDMAASKKEYLENKQREFRFPELLLMLWLLLSVKEGVQEQKGKRVVDTKMVCAFEITGHWRRWLESYWRLLEGRLLKISRNILILQCSGFARKILLVFKVVKETERIFKEWVWFRCTGRLMFNIVLFQFHVWGQSRIIPLLLHK